MLYRNSDGKLVEINKTYFINDKMFYEKIMELKTPFSKLYYETNKPKKNYSTFIIDKIVSSKNF